MEESGSDQPILIRGRDAGRDAGWVVRKEHQNKGDIIRTSEGHPSYGQKANIKWTRA